MASSITLDISSLTTQLSAGMTKIQHELANAVSAKSNEPDMNGMREQILANARTLYPLYFSPDDEVPDMEVVIIGSGTTIRAVVVYPTTGGDNDEDAKVATLFCTKNTASPRLALEKLLTLTSKLLNQNWRYSSALPDDCHQVDVAEGWYAMPED